MDTEHATGNEDSPPVGGTIPSIADLPPTVEGAPAAARPPPSVPPAGPPLTAAPPPPPPPPRKRGTAVPRWDILRALKLANGNIVLAAEALGISRGYLDARIKTDDQLRALYGTNLHSEEPAAPVGPSGAMTRVPDDLPPPVTTVELAEMVSVADREMHLNGLKRVGVSEEMLAKLRDLDGLAKSAGHFLSISLQKTHQMYYVQLVNLMEVTDLLRMRLLAKVGEAGYIDNNMDRAFLNRNYAEMVKASGDGYELMLKGAQAMVRMMIQSKDTEPKGAAKKPGFTKLVAKRPAA